MQSCLGLERDLRIAVYTSGDSMDTLSKTFAEFCSAECLAVYMAQTAHTFPSIKILRLHKITKCDSGYTASPLPKWLRFLRLWLLVMMPQIPTKASCVWYSSDLEAGGSV